MAIMCILGQIAFPKEDTGKTYVINKYPLNNENEDTSNKTNADAFDAARDQQCSKGGQRIDEGWQQLLYCHA